MKILQVIPAFYPAMAYGGTVAASYHLSRELARRGHEVTVYTSDSLDKYHRQKTRISEIDGIKAYYFKNISNRLAWDRLVFTPGMRLQLSKDIRNFDIIHLHGARSFQNIPAHYYAKKYSIPYVLQAHGSLPRIIKKQRLKKIFDISFGYKILRDATKVIALTRTEVEQYKEMGVDEDKIEIVPNGIDLSEYDNLPKRGEFRRKYSIEDDEKIILYIGRLHKSKGIDLLVKAFADLSKELNDAKLVLIGPDDGYWSALEGLIQALKVDDEVLFTGFVSNYEKMTAFVDADVFVTSRFSGFPVTFLEACACGTLIITTNKGDELEWIQDKVGYVVEYDKDELRDAIFKVLSDEGLRRRFGEEGRRLVEKEFRWDKVVKKVEGIYMSCLPSIKQKVI